VSAYRTSKIGEPFYSVLTVFDFDGTSTVSGQPSSAFVARFHRDNQEVQGVVHTVSELGTSGDYVLSVPGGFVSRGLWTVSVEVLYNGSTWRDDVEVRVHDIDDVYDVVVAGGTGVENVTFTVVDTRNGNIPVPDALINIYDATGVVLITFQRTDPSGNATVLLDASSYVVRAAKPGLSCVDQTFTVTNTGGLTPQSFQVDCESILVAPPASPTLCRIYADFITQDGLPFFQFKVVVNNKYDPASAAGMAMIESSRTHQTDANGHLEFDVVQGSRIQVSLVTTPWTREFVVPSTPVASLLTLFGAATDAFQVVKR